MYWRDVLYVGAVLFSQRVHMCNLNLFSSPYLVQMYVAPI